MFNMKTSDLFRRAKQLADLEGSDFISWNEAINCINEAHVGLYERLINMGDNSFVKSFHTSTTVELPEDFWQLKGVYLYNNGNLQTINRRADNNGIHHLSYELRNGNIELFGNPNDVLVEYFPKPKQLFFPSQDVEVNLDLPEGAEILDCFKHTFLYKVNDTYNIYDTDELKNAEDFFNGVETFPEYPIYKIINDFVIISNLNNTLLYQISTGEIVYTTEFHPIITESGNLYLMKYAENQPFEIYAFSIHDETLSVSLVKTVNGWKGYCYYADDELNNVWRVYSKYSSAPAYFLSFNKEPSGSEINNSLMHIYKNNGVYFIRNNKLNFIDNDYNTTEIKGIEGNIIGFIDINKNTGFGYCVKKYGRYFICSYCEDTELNFPNSFYFQIISYLLAIAFRSKQGADISLLSNQLSSIEQTFEDTLGSDSFQFPRMGNVYN